VPPFGPVPMAEACPIETTFRFGSCPPAPTRYRVIVVSIALASTTVRMNMSDVQKNKQTLTEQGNAQEDEGKPC
jgi:hypothetical protein